MIGLLLFLCLLGGIVLLALGLAGKQPNASARARSLVLRLQGHGWLSARFLGAVTVGAVVFGVFGWTITGVPVLGLAACFAGGYAPFVWLRRRRDQQALARERAWPAALAQLADALEAGIALPAALRLLAESGPPPLRGEFARLHTGLRSDALAAALDQLAANGERTAGTVALLLRAGLVELPAGGLAPMLRDLSLMLAERFEAREKARTKAASLQLEAAILALSPIVLLLLVGAASPDYLAAYRTGAGTLVAVAGGVGIFGCYLLMRRLGRIPEPRRAGAKP